MGLMQNFLEGFYYFCIGPVQGLLYFNLKLYCSLAFQFSGGELSFSPKKLGFSVIMTDEVSLGEVSFE
jgi:hypothetical protein